ncbi:MAG: 4Fe-4S binding protein [Clostridia bacterium]|nr:4Fe-4S binding protein [Clostridia bacterium]
MDAQTCLKKMYYVGVLAFATVDENGAPQVRNISAVHYDENSFYFFTARGKELTKQLQRDSRIQTLAYTKYNEMIRLSGYALPVEESRQRECIDKIFEEQPYLSNVYPGDTRYVGIIFEVKDADIEYFNLGVHPIFRETYTIGKGTIKKKGYIITDKCIGCGKCAKVCPQSCIENGAPYRINHNHCLHCGNCYENCPVKAIKRL